MNTCKIKQKKHQLPLFFPDATLGVVRGLASEQVAAANIEGVVINTYHLMRNPGIETLTKIGGIKKLMNWSGLATSDSGGFQLFSLIHKNPQLGRITDEGVVLYSGKKQQRKSLFTPEKSIQVQFAIGSDIMICLDDFSPVKAKQKRLKESVERTVSWAKRCKTEFEKQCQQRKLNEQNRPLLLAVVQGHQDEQLRRQCAEQLLEIGFDGYGLGGWPFHDNGDFDYQISQLVADLTPSDKLRFALGVGSPENIVRLRKMGYDLFDCVLPTRDARHQRLYIFSKDPAEINFAEDKNWYQYLYINRSKHDTDNAPISPYCDCPACKNHSRAYLRHLFKVKDSLAFSLASLHNLHFYGRLMKELQKRERKN